MKFTIFLLVAILVITTIECKQEKDHGKNAKNREHAKHKNEERSKHGLSAKNRNHESNFGKQDSSRNKHASDRSAQYRASINVTANASTSIQNSSWVKNYDIGSNTSIIIVYNQTLNYFATWNEKKQLAVLYATAKHLMGIYNATSGSLFRINTLTDEATVITNVQVSFKNGTDVPTSIGTLYNILLENKGVNATFSIQALLQAVLRGNISLIIGAGSEFIGTLLKNFANFFRDLTANLGNGLSGVGAIISPIFNGVTEIAKIVVNFYTGIMTSEITIPLKFIQLFITAIGTGLPTISNFAADQLQNIVGIIGKFVPNLTTAVDYVLSGTFFKNLTSGIINGGGGNNVTVNSGITFDNSWLVNIGNQYNSSVNQTIAYNSHLNVIGFVNSALKVATVFDGNNGYYAIYNMTSGQGLIVSQISGNAKFTSNNTANIITAFKGTTNYTNAFILITDNILGGSSGLNNFINFDPEVFSLRNLVFLLSTNFLSLELAFIGKGDVYTQVMDNFSGLFDAAREYFQKSFSFGLGPLNLVAVIAGANSVAQNFFGLIQTIFIDLGGLFNVRIVSYAFTTFNKYLQLGFDGFRSFIFIALANAINAAKGVTGGFDNIVDAIFKDLPSGSIDIHIQYGQPRNNTT